MTFTLRSQEGRLRCVRQILLEVSRPALTRQDGPAAPWLKNPEVPVRRITIFPSTLYSCWDFNLTRGHVQVVMWPTLPVFTVQPMSSRDWSRWKSAQFSSVQWTDGRMDDKRIKEGFIMRKRRWFHHHVLVPLKSSSTGSPIHDDDITAVCLKVWLKSNPFPASVIVTAEPPASVSEHNLEENTLWTTSSQRNNDSIFCVMSECDSLNCGY